MNSHKKLRIVLTGASGMLGGDLWFALQNAGQEVYAVGRHLPAFIEKKYWHNLDLTDAEQTYQTITQINPDVVVHSAAYSDVDGAESNPEEAFRNNALATRNLAVACQRFDTVILYISTDYVFSGDKGGPYYEYDQPAPLSIYGKSKLWGEEFVQSLLSRFYIVRTAWLFGKFRTSFIDKVIIALNSGQEIKAVTDMVGSPTFTRDLAQSIVFLLSEPLYGIYHLTNAGYTSRAELTEYIAELLGKSLKTIRLIRCRQADLGLPARRPNFSALANYHWQLNGFPPLREWEAAIKEYIENSGGKGV